MSFVPLSAVFAVVGAVFGVLADRLATRWPEHDEEHPGRPADRLADRRLRAVRGVRVRPCCRRGSAATALALALFGAWFATLVVGFAIDLDQRLLPDVLTLPVIPIALLYDVTGQNPLVGGDAAAGDRRRDRRARWCSTSRRSRSGRGRSGSAT